MDLDIRKIAEDLIVKLWGESDKLRERAEGVKLFLNTIILEGEKLNGKGLEGSQSRLPEETEKQAE